MHIVKTDAAVSCVNWVAEDKSQDMKGKPQLDVSLLLLNLTAFYIFTSSPLTL